MMHGTSWRQSTPGLSLLGLRRLFQQVLIVSPLKKFFSRQRSRRFCSCIRPWPPPRHRRTTSDHVDPGSFSFRQHFHRAPEGSGRSTGGIVITMLGGGMLCTNCTAASALKINQGRSDRNGPLIFCDSIYSFGSCSLPR